MKKITAFNTKMVIAVFAFCCIQLTGYSQNNCLHFDGSNDYIDIPSLGTGLNQFTLETWINPEAFSASLNGVYNTNSWTTGSAHLQFNGSGNICIAISGGSNPNIPFTYVFQTGTWYHLAITYNKVTSTMNLYVNGQWQQTYTGTNFPLVNFSAARIGSWSGDGRYFKGKLDDFRIWNRERTAENIKDSAMVLLTGTEPGLLAAYNFNQGTAGGSNVGLTQATNATGTNHATLTNFALSGNTSNWVSGIKDEPSSHVSNFMGALAGNKMTLSWTDATGGVVPDGYFIFATNDTNNFTYPVNGVEPPIDNNLSDGYGCVKVLQGTQTYNGWINEAYNTKYYFKIYPFTNQTSQIKYYTGENIPCVNVVSLQQFTAVASPIPLSNGMFWADYHNDGFFDMVTYLDNMERTAIYQNNLNGTFTKQAYFTLPAFERNLHWIDFDRNGFLDITGESTIYLNNANGTFTGYYSSLWGLSRLNGQWADFNNDGSLDLLQTADNGYDIILYQNTAGSYKQVYGNNFKPCEGHLIWFDYNNDGFKDILSTGVNPIDVNLYATIYKNAGNGKFLEQPQFQIPAGITKPFVCDYNADGWMDLILIDSTSSLLLFKNENGIGFTQRYKTNSSDKFFDIIATADINNDGYADILASYFINNYLIGIKAISYNNGLFYESYNQLFEVGGEPYKSYDPSITDINNDGNIDLFENYSRCLKNITSATNLRPNKITNASAVAEGNGIRFSWSATDDKTPSAGLTYNLRIGTSPGASNILSVNATPLGILKILEPGNMGTCTSPFFRLPKGTYYWNVQAVDNSYKGSPFMDVDKFFTVVDVAASNIQASVINNTSLKLKWNNGNGTKRAVFCKIGLSGTASPVNSKTYVASQAFTEGDQIGITGWYCVYNGIADSTIVSNLSSSNSYVFHVIEYTGSAGAEIYMTQTGTGNPEAYSTSIFSLQSLIGAANYDINKNHVKMADMNNNGYLDFLYYKPYTGLMNLYVNQGNNTFGETKIPINAILSNSAFHLFDYNSDGLLDFIYSGEKHSNFYYQYTRAYFYINNGNNTFTSFLSDSVFGTSYPSIASADFNNDGNIDLFVGGSKSRIVPANNAEGKITEFYPVSFLYKKIATINNDKYTRVNYNFKPLENGGACFGDFNNDGWSDLVISGSAEDGHFYIYLYLNNQDETFREQQLLVIQNQVYAGCNLYSSDFNKDGFCDLICGITSNKTIYFKNNGFGDFEADYNTFSNQTRFNTYTVSDFNNDGAADILFTDASNPFKKLYINNYPTNGFSIKTDFVSDRAKDSQITSGDYDNDGDSDFIVANDGDGIINVFRNTMIMKSSFYNSNSRPSKPNNLKVQLSPNELSLSWDAITSDESPFLSYNVALKKDTILFSSPNSNYESGNRWIPEMGNTGFNTFAVFRNLEPGSYVAKVQAVDGMYCGSEWSDSITFEIKNLSAYFTYDTVCARTPNTLTDLSQSTKTIALRQWKHYNNSTQVYETIATDSVSNYIFPHAGLDSIMLVVEDIDGLRDSVSHNIWVKSRSVAEFSAPPVCFGTATSFTDNTTLPDSVQTWLWNFGDGTANSTPTNATQQNYTYTYLSADTLTARLIVLNKNGCSDMVSKPVIVAPMPDANLSVSSDSRFTFCKNSGDSAYISVPDQLNCTYQWLNNNYDIADKINKSITIKENGGSFKVRVTNTLGGCSVTSANPVVITVNSNPEAPTIIQPTQTTICEGDTVKLQVTPVAGLSYVWNGGLNTNNLNTYNATTSGTYSLKVSNASGCQVQSTNTINVTVNPIPEIKGFSYGKTNFCRGDSVVFSAITNPDFTYKWIQNGVEITGTNRFTAYEQGIYSLLVINTYGCTSQTDNIDVNVFTTPDSPTINQPAQTTICEGDTVKLFVSQVPGLTYLWSGGLNTNNINTYNATTSGTYSLVTSNAGGCSAASVNSVEVTVNPKPEKPSVSYGNTEICKGNTVNFSVPDNSSLTYQWIKNETPVAGASSHNFSVNESGLYYLKLKNNQGCTVSTNGIQVNVYDNPPKPVIKERNNITKFCNGAVVELMVDNSSAQYNYQWQRSGVNIDTALSAVLYGKLKSGDYSVIARSGVCTSQSEILTLENKPAPPKPPIYASGPVEWVVICDTREAQAYRWYYNGELIKGANLSTYFANRNMGEYYFEISDGGECWTMSDIVTIPLPGTEPITKSAQVITVSPNPSNGIFTINLGDNENENAMVTVYNSYGKIIYSAQHNGERVVNLNLTQAENGVYLFNVIAGGNNVMLKLIKE